MHFKTAFFKNALLSRIPSRQIAMQSAEQIGLIQKNAKLVEQIKSEITIWLIFRNTLISSAESSLSAVSTGERRKITIAKAFETISNGIGVVPFNIPKIKMLREIDINDKNWHLVSVLAWYPPANCLITKKLIKKIKLPNKTPNIAPNIVADNKNTSAVRKKKRPY